MKRLLTMFLFCLLLPVSAAQDTAHLGIRLSGMTFLSGSSEPVPMVGFQVGTRVVGPFGFRLVAETFLFATSLHADLIYTPLMEQGWRGYGGVGADYFTHALLGPNEPPAYYGAHLTAGVEYRSGIAGFFIEAQPIYAFTPAELRLRIGLGANFYLL